MTEGAPPGSNPKAVRTSLVDSGWSAPPPASEETTLELARLPLPETRTLPSYAAHEASSGLPDVTQVDPKIQSRAKAMREKDTLPPPRRASAFPPAPPPVPVVRPQEPAVVIQNASYVTAPAPSSPPRSAPTSVRPPPKPASVRPPPASVRPPMPPARVYPAPASVPPAPAPAAAHEPDPQTVAAARSAATIVRPRSLQPPALPSFAAALGQRVRFAGGEVPLWSLVTPLVLLVALGAAFAAAAVTSATEPTALAPSAKASTEPSASVASALTAPLTPPAASVTSLQTSEEKPKPLSLLDRVAQGEEAAIKELASKPAASLNVEEAISLSLGQSAQDVRAARALRERIDHDPGLIKDTELLAGLRRYADNPETARDALAAMANIPGPISPDLIYEVWTSTASRTTATDLARALIYSKEIRAKASPALAAALDLRDAESCEQNRDLLPRITSDGDRRAFHLLGKLTRKYGCGPGKRQDCYPCLRDGKDLDAAMKAVKARREPRPFGS